MMNCNLYAIFLPFNVILTNNRGVRWWTVFMTDLRKPELRARPRIDNFSLEAAQTQAKSAIADEPIPNEWFVIIAKIQRELVKEIKTSN